MLAITVLRCQIASASLHFPAYFHSGHVLQGPDSHCDREQARALHEFFKGPKGNDKEVSKLKEKVEADKKELGTLLQGRVRQA
jgi:hypothetical protein